MKNSETFNNLIDNAFDFLQKALEELEQQPKYAAIHFYAAIELFLKARLLHEHWTLILTKPSEADLAKFHQGDFQSINLKDAHIRLKAIVQEGLTEDEYKCFNELGKHRNRVIHFYHAGQSDKQEIENIAAAQCRAWYYLYPILAHRWREIFIRYQGKFIEYEIKMHKQRNYLQAKFGQLENEILLYEQQGINFHECMSCGHKALKKSGNKSPIFSFECLVCHFYTLGVQVTCEGCNFNQVLIDKPSHQCTSCEKQLGAESVKKVLLAYQPSDIDDNYEGNCGECKGYHSVVMLSLGGWMCSNCLMGFVDMNQCKYCHDFTSEKLEKNGYLSGCGFCDGEMSR